MPRVRPLPAPIAALHPPGTTGRLDGPAIGFRVWKLTRDGRLRAVTASHEWQPGPNQALACRDDHDAPGPDCHCGFNAFSDPRTLRSALGGSRYDWVAGAIAQWGATHAHMTGQRSERARVVALHAPDSPELRAAADRAADRYQVPVIDTESDLVAYALEHADPVADRHVPLEPLLLLAAGAFRDDHTPPAATGPLEGCALRLHRWRIAARMTDWALDHAFAACRGAGHELLWETRACLLGCLNAAAGPDPWRTAHGEIEQASRTLARGPLTFADVHHQGAPADGPPVPLGGPPSYDTRRARLLAACLRHHQHVDEATISRLVDRAAFRADTRLARRSIAARILDARRLDINRAAWLTDTATCRPEAILDHPGVTDLAALSVLARLHDRDPGALLADPRTERILADPAATQITALKTRHIPEPVACAIAEQIVRRHGAGAVHDRVLVFAVDSDDPAVAAASLRELADRDLRLLDHVDMRRVAERHPPLAVLVCHLTRQTDSGTVSATDTAVAAATRVGPADVEGRTLRDPAHVAAQASHPARAQAAVDRARLAERCAEAGWTGQQAMRFAEAMRVPPDGPHRAVYMDGVRAGHHPGWHTYRLTDREIDETVTVLLAPQPRSPEAERALSAALAVISERRGRLSPSTLLRARRRALELLEAPPITAALSEKCRCLLDTEHPPDAPGRAR